MIGQSLFRNVWPASVAAVLLLAAPAAGSADWPQFRADSARSGYTPERLHARLELQWTYRSAHPPQPAWPEQPDRLGFDYAYKPVVSGGTLYFGSSADCKVYALDAATGRERWSFFTNGPVRFAPAVWKDRLLAVSDDGHLYCLSAKDGGLLWRRRGGPDGRKVLGNGRMMARCPARGAPAVHEDIIYWAAGIFPFHGFFLYATDAETGRTRWANDSATHIFMGHGPGGIVFTGVSAQGYLAVAGDTILVSTGRALPGGFDLADGRLRYFNPGQTFHTGSWLVVPVGGVFFGGDKVYDVKTGDLVCPLSGNRLRRGSPGEVVVTPKEIVIADGKELKCAPRSKLLLEGPPKDRFTVFGGAGGNKALFKHMNFSWKLAADCGGALIAAGDRLYAGGKGLVSAVEIGSHRVAWSARVEGTAFGLAAADGRLFVSTDKGLIYCFGAEGGSGGVVEKTLDPSPYSNNAAYARAAEEIVRNSGVTEGYCLDLGCGDGRLSYELAKRTKLQIIAVDEDEKKVAAARKALDAAGLHGARVTVLHARAEDLPDYFANLVVSGRSVAAGPGAVPTGELRRIQRPYGGVACIGRPGAMKASKRGPLQGAGSWTHLYCDSGNTGGSTDVLVKGPLGILWFGGPGSKGFTNLWGRTPAPLFMDGRLYEEGLDFVRCTDAYNGRVLWETQIKDVGKVYKHMQYAEGTYGRGNNFCVGAEGVYVHNRNQCFRLDRVTGRQLAAFKPPPGPGGAPGLWGYIAYKDGRLFGTVAGRTRKAMTISRRGRSGKEASMTDDAAVFAMDARTGAVKWVHRAKDNIRRTAIAVGGGRVYLIDRPRVAEAPKLVKNPVALPAGELAALDAATGRAAWKRDGVVTGTTLILSEEHDVLLLAYSPTRKVFWATDLGAGMAAYRASEGELLWERRMRYDIRPVIVGRTILAEPHGYDLLTGEPKVRANPISGKGEVWASGNVIRCGIYAACPSMLLYRTSTLTYFDLARDEGVSNFAGPRPGCFINILPVGGVVLMPQSWSGCSCNFLHRCSIALAPVEQNERWAFFQGESQDAGRVGRFGINLGAPGDRRDEKGFMWIAVPRPVKRAASLRHNHKKALMFDQVVKIDSKGAYRRNSDLLPVVGTDRPWIYASGCLGPMRITVNTSKMPAGTRYRVRLHFAEMEDVRPGERVFQVSIGDRTVLRDFDIVKGSGKRYAALVKEFDIDRAAGSLEFQLVPAGGSKEMPVVSGIEIEAARR